MSLKITTLKEGGRFKSTQRTVVYGSEGRDLPDTWRYIILTQPSRGFPLLASGDTTDDHYDGAAGAIIVAAGASRRMGGVDKILAPLLGEPLIAYSLRVFAESPLVGSIVLVMSQDNVEHGRLLVKRNGWHKVREVCAGGDRRQESVRIGLEKLPDSQWTIVHDGARPLVDLEMLDKGLSAAKETGAAVAAVPVKDTIKSARPDLSVAETISREGLWVAQTPQVFRTELLVRAHRRVLEDVTDDATMVERLGGVVRLFMGSYANIKVTTPEDLEVAEAILKSQGREGDGRVT